MVGAGRRWERQAAGLIRATGNANDRSSHVQVRGLRVRDACLDVTFTQSGVPGQAAHVTIETRGDDAALDVRITDA